MFAVLFACRLWADHCSQTGRGEHRRGSPDRPGGGRARESGTPLSARSADGDAPPNRLSGPCRAPSGFASRRERVRLTGAGAVGPLSGPDCGFIRPVSDLGLPFVLRTGRARPLVRDQFGQISCWHLAGGVPSAQRIYKSAKRTNASVGRTTVIQWAPGTGRQSPYDPTDLPQTVAACVFGPPVPRPGHPLAPLPLANPTGGPLGRPLPYQPWRLQ